MATYVLVHGGWGSSRTWREFVPWLSSKGHEVFAPTLIGLGERSHLGTPDTNLATHIKDVTNLIEYEALSKIVLAGWSYGGMVISGVADLLPDKVAHLVYIDAMLPADGQSARDVNPFLPAAAGEDGWHVPPGPAVAAISHLRPQPAATFDEKLRLSLPVEKRAFTRTFIRATKGGLGGALAAGRVKNTPDWRYFELDCGHNVAREKPEELAAILLDLAA